MPDRKLIDNARPRDAQSSIWELNLAHGRKTGYFSIWYRKRLAKKKKQPIITALYGRREAELEAFLSDFYPEILAEYKEVLRYAEPVSNSPLE